MTSQWNFFGERSMETRRQFVCVAFGALILFCTGCGSSELTRPKVKKIVEASADFSKGEHVLSARTLSNDALLAGFKESIIQNGPDGSGIFLTPKGQQVFREIKSQMAFSTETMSENKVYSLGDTVKAYQREVVEVTGISAAPASMDASSKVVEFTWTWKLLPAELAPLVGVPKHAEGLFKLYDDGWRIENLKLEKD
jgi:hypothetical protein